MDYRILVVDDDPYCLDSVSGAIQELLPGAVADTVKTGKAALALLGRNNYDVLLLTMPLEGLDSLRLLKGLPQRDFELICISAHADYALEAIKEGAADYLLKPVKKPALREALQKAIERRSRYLAVHNSPPEHRLYLTRKIGIPHQQGLWFVTLEDIVYLKADNTYTTIYTTKGEKITTSKPISRFESVLDAPWFYRIHKSYLINTSQFKAYRSRNGDTALMSNGDQLLISRYRLSKFLEAVNEVNGMLKI